MTPSDCANEALYASLQHCKGTTVLPGLRPHIFYIPKSDIVAWPTRTNVSDTGATMQKLGQLIGDFVLAADKKWHKIDLISPQSNVNSESQGEKPSKTFKNSGSFLYPGLNADAVGFARQANADDLVYLWPQRDGQYRVLGNESFETDTSPAQESGAGETDKAGTTINVSVTDEMPSPYYLGKIEAEDGDYSGADGSVIPSEEEVDGEG